MLDHRRRRCRADGGDAEGRLDERAADLDDSDHTVVAVVDRRGRGRLRVLLRAPRAGGAGAPARDRLARPPDVLDGRGGSVKQAISGLDIALWDLLGQATGQPVGRLLSSRYRDRVRPYASVLMDEPAVLADRLTGLRDKRFRAFKIGGGPFGRELGGSLEILAGNVEATFAAEEAAGIAGTTRVALASSISLLGLRYGRPGLAPLEAPVDETNGNIGTDASASPKRSTIRPTR